MPTGTVCIVAADRPPSTASRIAKAVPGARASRWTRVPALVTEVPTACCKASVILSWREGGDPRTLTQAPQLPFLAAWEPSPHLRSRGRRLYPPSRSDKARLAVPSAPLHHHRAPPGTSSSPYKL